jgi:outer membrane protein assembly factor BamD
LFPPLDLADVNRMESGFLRQLFLAQAGFATLLADRIAKNSRLWPWARHKLLAKQERGFANTPNMDLFFLRLSYCHRRTLWHMVLAMMLKRSCVRLGLLLALLVALPFRAPAPVIYRPGEGWSYEMPGKKGDWHKLRAKDQLDVAQQAFDEKKYKLALKAAKRVITVWPLSDFAPKAQYLIARCYEERKQDEYAFDAYQTLLDKYPRAADVSDVQHRQFVIALRFLHGEWRKLWGHIPFFKSMDLTSDMFAKIVRYGPYGPLGPTSQMYIGAAREKEKDYPLAVRAYELAADRYSEQPDVAANALYSAALAYNKQARKPDYDQSVAGQAISGFTDFMALFPNDPRVAEAQRIILQLKTVEAAGNFKVAQYYEKEKQWAGALVYYNEVLIKNPSSPLAGEARRHIEVLAQRTAQPTPTAPTVPAAPPTPTAPPK